MRQFMIVLGVVVVLTIVLVQPASAQSEVLSDVDWTDNLGQSFNGGGIGDWTGAWQVGSTDHFAYRTGSSSLTHEFTTTEEGNLTLFWDRYGTSPNVNVRMLFDEWNGSSWTNLVDTPQGAFTGWDSGRVGDFGTLPANTYRLRFASGCGGNCRVKNVSMIFTPTATPTPPPTATSPPPTGGAFGSQCYYEPTGTFVTSSVLDNGGFDAFGGALPDEWLVETDPPSVTRLDLEGGPVGGPPAASFGSVSNTLDNYRLYQYIGLPTNWDGWRGGFSFKSNGASPGETVDIWMDVGGLAYGRTTVSDAHDGVWSSVTFETPRIGQGGYSIVSLYVESPASFSVDFDELWLEAVDEQDEVVCLDPLLEPSPTPTTIALATFEFPTPVATPTFGALGGGTPVPIPVTIAPQPTSCFVLDPGNLGVITTTLPSAAMCIEPSEITLDSSNWFFQIVDLNVLFGTMFSAVIGSIAFLAIRKR